MNRASDSRATPSPAVTDDKRLAGKRRAQIVDAAVKLFSTKGYFKTTVEDIAREAGVSKGLIYLYFKDKGDVLYYSLRFVLELYSEYMPTVLKAHDNPLLVLRKALRIYCRLVNNYQLETVLAYRSSKDLSADQRLEIKVHESRASRIIRASLDACIHGGLIVPVNSDILTYQYIMFAHTWALKNWAFRDSYTFAEYLHEGERILLLPLLTEAGRREMAKLSDQGDDEFDLPVVA